MDNRPISELDSAISVNDEDILLISQKENNEYVSRKIGAGVFRGDSAYELAVKEGFKGDLNAWLSSIKGWQPITSGEFVGLLDSELDKSELYKDLNNRLNASTTTLREDINKQLNDINTLRQEVVAEADKRIQEIHNLNTGLIEEANKRIQDIKLVQESITLETSERLEQAVELANQILLEKDSRTDDIKNLIEKLNSEQSDRIAAVQEVVDLLSSEIETRRSLLSETVQKINKETADRVKEIESVRNSITQEQLARVSELEDIMKSIDAVDTKVGINHSFLLNNYSTTKTASEETAKQIEALRTTYIDPKLEQKASTTALEQITTEVGTINDALQANITKTDGVFAKVNPSMAGTESGYIGDESKYVGVWTEQSARIEEDFALGKRVDNVVATYTSNKETTDARIAREEKARADGDSALASVVTSLTTRVGNSEGKLVTLEQVTTDTNSSLSQMSSKLDNTIQELDSKASSSALSDLSSNVEVLEESINSATNSVTSLKNNLDTVAENINKKADSSAVSDLSSKVSVLDETVTSNSNNIIALTGSLGSKNKTYYQATVPTENVAVGDVWVNSTPSKNNELKRYNGLYWDVISDPRVSSNSSAISSLESKTTQHDEDITSQAQLITDLQSDLNLSKENLLLKADSSALSDLSNTVSSIDGKVTSVSEDITQLKSNLTNLEENVDSKADASALEDLSSKVEKTSNSLVSQGQDITNLNNSLVTVNTNINSKGKVIYSENEPSEVERLAQNLWIDTKDGNNTPKRWDGVEWIAVTDKVAAEALAKAEANSEVLTTKADASAVSSLTNKVENVEKTITSQSNDLVVLTNSLEQTSQLAADKGKVIFSNVEPEESERILQNLWIDTSNNNNTPKRWTGTKWSTVTDKVALDALTASQAVSDALTTKADSSAVSSLESKVTDLGESISSQSQDITTLNNSLVLANNTISGKGKIIYSDSAPAEGDRLPQNLWIDTTSGGNIPKRWNGEFWLVITDKTALDALAAANQVKEDLADKVDSSAFNSLTSRVNSSERAITSQSDSITKLNNDLTVTDQIAREALSDSKDLKEQITTKASTEALENLTSSVISIDGKVTTNTQKVLELTGTVEAIGENLSTKADASVLTDYSTKIDTNEAISKANTTLTSSYTKAVEDVRTETNTKLDDQLLITKASTSGKLLYADATFLKGFNSVSAYDNNSTNKVVVDRITREIDNPTKSSHQLKITIANGATPGYGGFYQLIPSRANAVFVIKYLMKVPNTYTVIPTANALGSGSSDKIIGSAAGTGKYETYVRVIRCGDSGSFSTGGHIYFYGTSLPKDSTDTVMLASIECWDATDFVKSATSDEVATISASLVNDYYTKTDADKAVSNSLTAFQTNYVDKELNKKASANTVDQISNEIHNTETGLDATAKKLSGVYAQVNPEFIGSEKGYIGKNSGSVSVWSEYSARIEGDLALSTRIDSVKADWEGNLASVQTQTKATSDKVSSLASQITVLSSAVEGNISLVMDQYYTKVQTGQVVSQGISDFKANYVAPQLNLKASSQALEQTQSQVTEIDGKLKTTSQRTEGVYAQVNPDLVGSDSGSIGTENQNVGSWSQYSALIEGDFATSQKIDVVSAAVANNTASIKQTNTVVIDKFKSVAESLNRVETKFNDNLSSVNSVIGVWSDKDKSISKYIIDLNSLVGSNQAEITRNYLTSADTTKAITEGIDRFKTEYLSDELKKKASAEVLDQVKSAIENTETGLVATADKLDGVFVKVNPKLIGSDRDFIGSTSSSVGIWTEYSARIEEDFALGNRIDNLYVNLGKNAAAIQTVNNVLVDKTQALAKSITHIDSKFESSVGSINTKLGTWTSSESSISDYITDINSAVGKNSSSIQIQGKSIDGLSSQYTVKLDTNGRVSGFGLASNPTNQATSEFAVVADKFYIASPDTNDKGKNPFYVLTKNQVADGVTIPAGVYIDQTFIRKASIDTTHIKDASIVNAKIFDLDAAKLTTGYISAERIEGESISAKHLQVGSVTEAKFSPSVLNNYLTSNQFVSDSLSDNVLTASEKTSIKNNWEQIKNNLKFYLESAKIFDITIATPAYTDLSAYILTLNLDDTNSTQIDSELFKAKFNAWYAEEYAIRSAIDAKVKDLNKNSLNQATSATDLLNRWKANKNNTLYIDDNRIAVNMIAAENIAADSITADKIKFGGVSSQNLANDIKSDISKGVNASQKVSELAANLDDDNILIPVEKTFLFNKWQEVEKTNSWIGWQCSNVFGTTLGKETIYDPYYNLLRNFITENVSKDGLNKSTNIATITVNIDGNIYGGSEAMRQIMLSYYDAENKMLSKLQESQYNFTSDVNNKATMASSVLDKLADDNVITKQEKPALKLQYTNIINDYDDLALAASNQGISSSVFATAYNDLVNVFNLIFQDMASDTSWPGDDLRAKMRAYSDQRGFLIQRLSNDAKDKANEASAKSLEALQALTKMADDNVITIYEKPALSYSWQNIINDFDDLELAGKNQQIDTADFKTAYTSLKSAVDLILANPSVDTEWSGQDLRDRMKSYADQRGSIIQKLANDAEEKANAAMSAITDAVSDRILTPSEKQQFKIKWVEEYQDFDKLKLKAQEANISSSNGNYSNYVSAFNYINDTFTPVWNSADNSQVDPTEWKTRFETLRKYKTLLENEISAKIKDIASSALSATQQLNQTVANKADSSALLSLDHDVKVIDGQVKAYGESITSLSADLSNKVGKGDVNSIIGETQNGKKHIVSTEGLDNNLYYPVTIGVTGLFSKISMLISLGEAKATWATHSSSGWSCGLTVTQRASGWGGNSIDLTIEKFDYAWTNQSPVINVGQLSTMSSALFYVRGGSKYHFYVDSNCYAPQLWTEKKIFDEQYNIYVEPITYSSGLEPKSLKQNVQSNSVATSTLRANVDEINGKVVAQSSSILNLQTNVDTISRDLTTKANSSVLAQYYTRDEADRATAGKIENFNSSFEIGGRNYFRKTTPLNPHQLQEVRRDLPDTPNGFYVVGSQTPSNNLRLPGVITGNGKWTISGWVRGSQNTAISFFIDICDKELSKQIVINKDGTNSWEKFTYTVTVDNYSTDTYNFVDISNLSWAYFYFKDIKIEKGSKATDWTPAPEDVDAKIATTDATINEFKQTQATKDSATAEQINTISTKVNDNEAAIKVQAQSINGINAQYTIKTDVNGKVAGIGLVNSGKSSEFSVAADTFRVSNGSTDIAPFSISGNNIVFNGKVNFNNVNGRPSTITLVGTSLDLPVDQQKSITYLDKDNYSTDTTGSRGVRLTVYNPDSMQPVVNQIFDTYTPQGCAEFKSKVFGLSLDKLIVTVRSMDATLYNNQDFIDAMNKLRLDGNGINSALKYKVRTSFAGASQYFASDNSTTSVLVVDGNELGKQKPAIVMISIKDGKMIPESVSSSDGMHKLNDAAGIAINNLSPTIQSLTSLVGTEDKVKSIVRNTTEINGGNIITGTISADKLEARSITSDYIQVGSISKDRIDTSYTQSIDNTKTSTDRLTTAIKNSSNWDGSAGDLTISRNNISGGKDLANLWTNQLFDPAFPQFESNTFINEGKGKEHQGSNKIKLNARHVVGDWSTKFYVKPGEQYLITFIGYNYSGVGFYSGLWVTKEDGGDSTIPPYSGFSEVKFTGEAGSGWKYCEALFTVPLEYPDYIPLVGRAHFFQDTYDFNKDHCKISNLVIKKVISQSNIDGKLVDAANKAKEMVDNIVSDKKITPDEKQSLLLVFNEITNDNNTWRDQAHNLKVDYTRQNAAKDTVLSTQKPYLGWVCRSDALNITETLNDGERATLINAISEYYAANEDLAKRVGAKAKNNTDAAALSASNANAALSKMADDNIISIQEKPALKLMWENISNDFDDLELGAREQQLSSDADALVNSYNNLKSAMDSILADMNVDTFWNGSDLRSRMKAYSDCRGYITQRMSNTANQKAKDAITKIDDLKIGGTNLVIPSFDRYNGSSGYTGFLVSIPQPNNIVENINYTLSFDVSDTENVTVMGIGFSSEFKNGSYGDFWNPDNSVGKKVWTGKLSSRYSKSFFYIWINSACSVSNIKLEEGDKPTSYEPSDYRNMRSLIYDRPNDKLQNKWAYIAYKKPQPSANEMMHYGYLEGDIVSQGYVNVGNTMFSDTKFDNTYIIFRTIVTPNSVVNSGLFNFIGDDAHSIYVNGQMLYSSTLYKGGGNIPFKLFSGANNVIDILVSNGIGGAGFSTTTALQDLGKMCAPSLTAVELETNSKLINDIFDDNKVTPDEKQTLLVTYKQIQNDNDIWRNQAYLLGGNTSDDNGVNHRRQHYATLTLLSTDRPYLGWVCRSDALNQTDTLNTGERTTLMNAISEYYAATQDLAQRVGSNLRTTGSSALQSAGTANNKIDNLKIGGENLLLGGELTYSKDSAGWICSLLIPNSASGEFICSYEVVSASANTGTSIGIGNRVGGGEGDIPNGYFWLSDLTIGKHVSPISNLNITAGQILNIYVNSNCVIKNIKLEKGNRATDFSVSSLNSDMKVLDSVLSSEPNIRLMNKWSYTVFKNIEDNKEIKPHYYNIKGSIIEQGYVNVGKTFFENTKYDNTIIVYRAVIDIPSDRYLSLGSITGDDGHSVFIDGRLVHSYSTYSTNSMSAWFVKAGKHIIDIIVCNITGGSGFRTSTISFATEYKLTGVNIPKVEQQRTQGNLISNTNQDKEMSLFRWEVERECSIFNSGYGNFNWLYIRSSGNSVVYTDFIKVDSSKAYTLSMDLFCTANTGTDYIGIYAYDANMNTINSYQADNEGTITENGNFYFWIERGSGHNYVTKQVTGVILPASTKKEDLVGIQSLYGTTPCIFNPNTAYIRIRVLNHYNEGNEKDLLLTNQKLVETDAKTIYISSKNNKSIIDFKTEVNDDNTLTGPEKTYINNQWLQIKANRDLISRDTGDLDKYGYNAYYYEVKWFIDNYIAPSLGSSTDIKNLGRDLNDAGSGYGYTWKVGGDYVRVLFERMYLIESRMLTDINNRSKLVIKYDLNIDTFRDEGKYRVQSTAGCTPPVTPVFYLENIGSADRVTQNAWWDLEPEKVWTRSWIGSWTPWKFAAKEAALSVKIGSQNLLKESNKTLTTNTYGIGGYGIDTELVVGRTYTLVVKAGTGGDSSQPIMAHVNGNQQIGKLNMADQSVSTITFTAANISNRTVIDFYNWNYWENRDRMSWAAVYWAILVEGEKSALTEWQPSKGELGTIFSDNYITPSEKTALLATYKQIVSTNDIWRNQAYNMGGNDTNDGGVNFATQATLAGRITSGNKPYLGWLTRSDALNTTDYLTDSEKELFQSTLSNYYSADQNLAQRVGAELKRRADKGINDASTAQNRADSAYNSANYLERYNVDLDSYKTTGKYFVRSLTQGSTISGTDNELSIWMYLVVDAGIPERITQTAWHDQTPDKVWTRVWTGYWQAWKRQTDTQHVKNLITDPKVNTIAADAKSLLDDWKTTNPDGKVFIDGTRIAANSIAANQVAAGAITSEELATGAITTEKLAVGASTNLWANPEFKDYGANIRTMVNNGSRNSIGGRNGWYFNGNAYGTDDTRFPVCGGEEYLFDYIIGYHSGNCNVGFHLYNHAGEWQTSVDGLPTNYIDLGSGWYRASTSVKIPSNVSSAYLARVSFWAHGNSALTISDLIVTRKNSGQLIVDGTITANKIDSRGLTIKDTNGNVILGAGTGLNVSNITGLGSFATRNGISAGEVGGLGSFATVNKLTTSNISTYIDGLGVRNLLVGDAQITNANIGTAEVDTLNIRGQAVTVTSAITQTTFFDAKTSANTDAIYLYTGGVSVAVEFSLISCNPEGSGSFLVECYVNDVVKGSWSLSGTFGYYPSMFFPFSVATGTEQTKVHIKVTSKGAKIGSQGYFFKVTGLKR